MEELPPPAVSATNLGSDWKLGSPCGCGDLSVRLGSRISPHYHQVVVKSTDVVPRVGGLFSGGGHLQPCGRVL